MCVRHERRECDREHTRYQAHADHVSEWDRLHATCFASSRSHRKIACIRICKCLKHLRMRENKYLYLICPPNKSTGIISTRSRIPSRSLSFSGKQRDKISFTIVKREITRKIMSDDTRYFLGWSNSWFERRTSNAVQRARILNYLIHR